MGAEGFAAEAKLIGEHYAEAKFFQGWTVDRLCWAGSRLLKIRDALPHGEWQLWLKEHQAVLGFEIRTAQRLIRLVKTSRATPLSERTDDEMVELSRQVWGHEPELAPNPPAEFSGSYRRITGFLDWISKHSVADIPDAELIELKPRIELMQRWLAELEGKAKRLNLRLTA